MPSASSYGAADTKHARPKRKPTALVLAATLAAVCVGLVALSMPVHPTEFTKASVELSDSETSANRVNVQPFSAYADEQGRVFVHLFLKGKQYPDETFETVRSPIEKYGGHTKGQFDLYNGTPEFECSRGAEIVEANPHTSNTFIQLGQYNVVVECPFDAATFKPSETVTVSIKISGSFFAKSPAIKVVPAFEGSRHGLAVCLHGTIQGKGDSSDFDTDVLNSWVTHWAESGASQVYMYNWKASRGPHASAIDIDAKHSDIVNVNEIGSEFPIAQTEYAAQRFIISDCFHKSKAAGYKWVAFGDTDEFFKMQVTDESNKAASMVAWLDTMQPDVFDVNLINWYHQYEVCDGLQNVNKRALPLEKMSVRANEGAAHGRPKNIVNVGMVKHYDSIHGPPSEKENGGKSVYYPSMTEVYFRHYSGVQTSTAKICTSDANKQGINGQEEADFVQLSKQCQGKPVPGCLEDIQKKQKSLDTTMVKGWDLQHEPAMVSTASKMSSAQEDSSASEAPTSEAAHPSAAELLADAEAKLAMIQNMTEGATLFPVVIRTAEDDTNPVESATDEREEMESATDEQEEEEKEPIGVVDEASKPEVYRGAASALQAAIVATTAAITTAVPGSEEKGLLIDKLKAQKASLSDAVRARHNVPTPVQTTPLVEVDAPAEVDASVEADSIVSSPSLNPTSADAPDRVANVSSPGSTVVVPLIDPATASEIDLTNVIDALRKKIEAVSADYKSSPTAELAAEFEHSKQELHDMVDAQKTAHIRETPGMEDHRDRLSFTSKQAITTEKQIAILPFSAYGNEQGTVHAAFFVDDANAPSLTAEQIAAIVGTKGVHKTEHLYSKDVTFKCTDVATGTTVDGEKYGDANQQNEKGDQSAVVLSCPFGNSTVIEQVQIDMISPTFTLIARSAAMTVTPTFRGTRKGLSVCLHGAVQRQMDPDLINSWVQHWTKAGGANRFYVYDWKISRGVNPKPITIDPPSDQMVKITQLDDSVSSRFPLHKSYYGGQYLVIADCFQRAKSEGAKWVAMGDADEYVALTDSRTVLDWLESMAPSVYNVQMPNYFHSFMQCSGSSTEPVNLRNLPLERMQLVGEAMGLVDGGTKNIIQAALVDSYGKVHEGSDLSSAAKLKYAGCDQLVCGHDSCDKCVEDAISKGILVPTAYRPDAETLHIKHYHGLQVVEDPSLICSDSQSPAGTSTAQAVAPAAVSGAPPAASPLVAQGQLADSTTSAGTPTAQVVTHSVVYDTPSAASLLDAAKEHLAKLLQQAEPKPQQLEDARKQLADAELADAEQRLAELQSALPASSP
eukprot:SAG11_NODE_1158_length_5655_cov_6.340173_1_plen_1303_part_00